MGNFKETESNNLVTSGTYKVSSIHTCLGLKLVEDCNNLVCYEREGGQGAIVSILKALRKKRRNNCFEEKHLEDFKTEIEGCHGK